MISAFEAKTNLSRYLHDAERGQTMTITRHGKPVAILGPVKSEHRIDDLRARFASLRESFSEEFDITKLKEERRKR